MIEGKFAYPDSQYGELYPCNLNCTSCQDNATNCQSCIEGFYLLNDTECVPECKTLLIGEDKCYNCTGDYAYFQDFGCVKCLDDPQNYMLLKTESNHCFKDIPAGNYSDSNRILHPCHEYCTLCKDSPTNCQECKSSYYYYMGTCLVRCKALNEGYLSPYGCIVCESMGLFINETSLSNECVEMIDGYYADENNHIHPCEEGCKSCSNETNCTECFDGYFLLDNTCNLKCPLTLIEDSDTNECYSCNTDNLFLNYTSRLCIKYFSSGYYLYKDRDDNVLYPCEIDCSVKLPNFDNSFCEDPNVYHKCYSEIVVDSSLSLHYNPFSVDNQKIAEFEKMTQEEQIVIIDEMYSSLNSNTDNTDNATKIMEEILQLNQFITATKDERKIKEFHAQSMKIINSALNCDKLLNVTANSSTMIYTSSLFLYQTIQSSQNYTSEDDINLLSKIEKCLIKQGINAYNVNDTNVIWMQNDFFEMSTKATDNMLNTLEKSTDIKNSENVLIVSDSRKNYKQVIEGISKMQSSFMSKDTQRYENIEFITKTLEEIKNEQYINDKMLITTSLCNNTEKQIKQLTHYNLTTKLCLPYDNIKLLYPQVEKLSIINYKYYPLLNPQSVSNISKSFNAIILRDANNSIVDIDNLTEPIVIILKKPFPSFNECVFYDEKSENLSNSNCNSTEINEDYIMCSCYHLTDFSLSKYNPVLLIKDMIRLFQQARFINSFEQFKYINASNATVLYVVCSIIVIYSLLLVLAVRRDRKEGDSQFVGLISKEEPCCGDNDDTEEELKELDNKIRKYTNKRNSIKEAQSIEMKTISDTSTQNSTRLSTVSNSKKENMVPKSEHRIKEVTTSLFYTYYLLLKEFFKKEYWFCTFINSENEMSKVNILTVFCIRLVVSLSICSIFTECSSIEEQSEDLYNNRDLAVSVATILIMELPFTFLEVLLAKTKISSKYLPLKDKIILNTKYRHIMVYILFVIMLIFGTMNTLWISLDSYHNSYECNFMTDFFISTIFDCFIFQIITLLLKSLIYIFILKGRKNNCIRGCLICVVSSLPWIFNL